MLFNHLCGEAVRLVALLLEQVEHAALSEQVPCAEGEEGWCAYDNLAIGSERVVTFLRRQKTVKIADPEKDKEKTISDLWTSGSDE